MAAAIPSFPYDPEAGAVLGAELIESDCRYFELGAQVRELPAAQLAWMPDLVTDPAACVVQRVSPASIPDPDAWVRRVEAELTATGAPQARIYLTRRAPALERALAGHGYEMREEIAYARTAPFAHRSDSVALRRVVSDADWDDKLALHEACMERPDGYENVAARWVALERAKCATREMQAFLIEVDGTPNGTIGAMRFPHVLRAKNVLVSARVRRRGVAVEALRLLREYASTQGIATLGIFGIRGEPGDAAYRSAGMTAVASQYEWSKPLASR